MKMLDLGKCRYPGEIQRAFELGLVSGVPVLGGVEVQPGRPVTREENILFMLRVVDYLRLLERHDVPGLIEKVKPAIVKIWCGGKVGSGSFVKPNRILTNWHVINKPATIFVDTVNNRKQEIQARVVKESQALDLAVLDVSPDIYPGKCLPLADRIIHGEGCLTLGSPLGEWMFTSLGIVSRLGSDVIQVDALVNPGNSGGAVVNMKGQLLGVPTWKIVGDGIDNMNYSRRVEVVREFLEK